MSLIYRMVRSLWWGLGVFFAVVFLIAGTDYLIELAERDPSNVVNHWLPMLLVIWGILTILYVTLRYGFRLRWLLVSPSPK